MRTGTTGEENGELIAQAYGHRPRLDAADWGVWRAFFRQASGPAYGHLLRMRLVSVCVFATLTVLAVMIITTAAFARTSHPYESVIGEVPTEGSEGKPVPLPGLLGQANSMTVFSGDIYVAESPELKGIPSSVGRTDQFAPIASKPGEYGFVSQLPPQPEAKASRYGGIAFGSAAGETEMYIGQRGGPTGVDVFSTGLCDNLECSNSQTVWTGAGAPAPFEVPVDDVAVDHSMSPGDWASGDIFVADAGNGVIDIFEPQAGGKEKYVTQVTGPSPSEHFTSLRNVAVSGLDGDLVVSEGHPGGEEKFYLFRPIEEGVKKGKYAFVKKLIPPTSASRSEQYPVAIDDRNGEIYVANAAGVYEFGPEGALRGVIIGVPKEGVPTGSKGQIEEVMFNIQTAAPTSLAVDPESHRVFVGLFGSHVGPGQLNQGVVDVFGPDVVVPDVVTGPPSNLALKSDPQGLMSWEAKPTGEVNPDEAGVASCEFVWGVSEVFGQDASCSAPVANGGGGSDTCAYDPYGP
ncbi:MAG: hypothetical protein WB709_06970 [Solirubrobacteraceae bacterium]